MSSEPRERPLLRAAITAATVFAAQILLAHLTSGAELGTRALGAGTSLATALYLGAGYALGRARRGAIHLPWEAAALSAVFLSALGLAGWLGGVFDPLFPADALGEGGLATAMLATDGVGFASFLLMMLGAQVSARGGPRTGAVGLLGTLGLVGFVLGAWALAREVFIDPGTIRAVVIGAILGGAILSGFFLAWLRRALAIFEVAVAQVGFGYALFLSIALGPPNVYGAWSLPMEQVLLALSIVPSVVLTALAAVGASLGFLLFGSGRFDPHFGYEVTVALRYLQVSLRGTRGGVLSFVATVLVILASVGGGFYGYRSDGLLRASWLVAWIWVLPAVLLPGWRHRWGRAAILGVVAAGVAAASWSFGWFGLGTLAAVPFYVLGFAVRGRRPPGKHPKPPAVGVVTVISVVGVALGVLALIVVLSVMSGFENDLKGKILGAHAHVVIEKYGDDFEEYAEVEAQARAAPMVVSAAAFVLGDAMMSTDSGLSGALIKGIDFSSDEAVGELADNLERGRIEYMVEPSEIPGACGRRNFPLRPLTPPKADTASTSSVAKPVPMDRVALGGSSKCPGRVLPGVILGRELSRSLRAYVGDVVKLVSPASDELGPLGPTPKLRRFRVAGIFYSGMYEYDAKLAYVSMLQAQRFFGMRKKATGVEMDISDIEASGTVVSELERRLGGEPYRIKDWRDMNKELFSALLLEKIAMFVALAIIITVASFLIVATLVMIVLQRGREIAILKSVGASSASIMKIFVVQGVIVGVGGALLGVSAGVGICLLLETVGLRLDERIFYIEKLPVVLDWAEVSVIAASAMVITYLSTIYPAMIAARLTPVEGLREE